MSTTDGDMSYSLLQREQLGPCGENAVVLAPKLEATVVKYLPETMYCTQNELCGGDAEAKN